MTQYGEVLMFLIDWMLPPGSELKVLLNISLRASGAPCGFVLRGLCVFIKWMFPPGSQFKVPSKYVIKSFWDAM